jgi:uncharacterized protein YjbJ (UPF0337 family)
VNAGADVAILQYGTSNARKSLFPARSTKGTIMDKDRIKGAGDQAKGAIKTGIGKVTGDEKLKQEGRADKIKGKVENAVGGAKDAVRDLRKRH